MPLTLHPPRKGKSPNYEIRGTYLGFAVNEVRELLTKSSR